MNDTPDPELESLEAIYDALDTGEPELALRLAREAATASDDQDPVVRLLAGVALLELDRSEDAVRELQRAAELDPDDGEIHANLALALFQSLRFEQAGEAARRAEQADPKLPDAHFVRGLLLEREERWKDADRSFGRAARLDPETFPAPRRLSSSAFEEYLRAAADRLPETFRRHLDEVAVTVEPLPSDALLSDEGGDLAPDLLGLFVGVPLTEQTTLGVGGELPPRILIFQRNLERHFVEDERLTEEIARTLYHELGHYLGLDEDELEAIDLG